MRKYNKNLYQHEDKWYTKENRVAKVGELVLIINKSGFSNNDFKNGDILKIINATGQWTDGTRYGNKIGQYLEQSEYMVLVPCATAVTLTANDTYFDEFTQMDQPVPFSKEYYNAPRKVQIGDWVEALSNKSGGVKKGEKYQVISLENTEDWVYVRSPEISGYTGCHANTYIKQPFSFLNPFSYKLCPEPTVADTINNTSKTPKEQYTFKRKWTDAEITEAKDIVYNAMTGIKDNCITVCSDNYCMNSNITATMYTRTGESTWRTMAKGTAKCCSTDTFNFDIGYMVAVCKLLGVKLPAWMGDKK